MGHNHSNDNNNTNNHNDFIYRGSTRNSINTDKPAAVVHIKLEFGSVDFAKSGKPWELGENQQQTQPTRDNEYGDRTRVAEMGGKRLSIRACQEFQISASP